MYRYDLISGKVNQVAYQPSQPDAFYHRYTYDAENRLTDVETSRDSMYWEKEAYYQYYKHGPLARTVVGNQQVQGIDYAYTLQGWLKGVNSTALTAAYDMGGDGSSTSKVAGDAFGFALHYYGTRDYKPIQTGVTPFAEGASAAGFKPLFNGNIGAMSVNIPKVGEPLLYAYTYDQLNRLSQMLAYRNLNLSTNSWTADSIQSFKEKISYNANGNILTYFRNGNNANSKPLAMDNLSYHYIAGTNKLEYVSDTVNRSNYTEDIDGQSPGNYSYDAIGNLVRDSAERIGNIEWTVYGKIKKITKMNGSSIYYTYDASGNRISKSVIAGTGGCILFM